MALSKAIPTNPTSSNKGHIQVWKLKLDEVLDGDVVTLKGWHSALSSWLQPTEGKAYAPYRFDKLRFSWGKTHGAALSGDVQPIVIDRPDTFNSLGQIEHFTDDVVNLNTIMIVRGQNNELGFANRTTPNLLFDEQNYQNALKLLLLYFAGCTAVVNEIMSLETAKGGVTRLEHYFSAEHLRLLSNALQIGARKLIQVCPVEYEPYIEEGETFLNLSSVLDQLMVDKKCQADEPHLQRHVALYYTILSESDLSITSSQRAYQNCVKNFLLDWSTNPVRTNEMNKSTQRYREIDTYSPSLALMGILNNLIVINDKSIITKALQLLNKIISKFALVLNKQAHQIDLFDIFQNKDKFYEIMDQTTGKDKTFDITSWLEKYNENTLNKVQGDERPKLNQASLEMSQNLEYNRFAPRYQNLRPKMFPRQFQPRNFNLRPNGRPRFRQNVPRFQPRQTFGVFRNNNGFRPRFNNQNRRRPQKPYKPKVISRRNNFKIVIIPEDYEFSEGEDDSSDNPLNETLDNFNKMSLNDDSYNYQADQGYNSYANVIRPDAGNTNNNPLYGEQIESEFNQPNLGDGYNNFTFDVGAVDAEGGYDNDNNYNYNIYHNNDDYNYGYVNNEQWSAQGYEMYPGSYNMAQTEIPTHSPLLKLSNSMFINKITPTIIYDTGADRTLIPKLVVDKIRPEHITLKTPVKMAPGIDAQGNDIFLEQYLISLNFILENGAKLEIKNATVANFRTARANNKILLGIQDICLNKLGLVFNKESNYPELLRKNEKLEFHKVENNSIISSTLSDFEPKQDEGEFDICDSEIPNLKLDNASLNPHGPKFSDFQKLPLANELNWTRFPLDHNIENWLKTKYSEVLFDFGLNNRITIPINRIPKQKTFELNTQENYTTKQLDKYLNPDALKYIMHTIEKVRQTNLTTFTLNDLKIDPRNEVLDLSKSSDRKIKRKIIRLARKYYKIFGSDVGCIEHPDFVIDADIDEKLSELSSNKKANYLSRYSEDVKFQLTQKLNKELADGILVPCEISGVVPANFLPIFPVAKKEASGQDPFLHISGIRLVNDCKVAANKFTRFRSHQGDDIRAILRKVATFSNPGLIISCDISECFHAIKIHPKLYKYFCLDHPDLGPVHFTRLPQGWLQSPSASRDLLNKIFYPINHQIVRYVDDLLGGTDNWESFFILLEKIFKILNYYNLRIKGKKTLILSKKLEFLGRKITGGRIFALPHHVDRLNKFSHLYISTKKQLKQFLGLCAFISEHKPHAATILHPLRRVSEGNNKDIVKWTPELIDILDNIKKEMSDLIGLYPINPQLDTYLVCDTSYLATGACLYQKTEKNETRIIAFFSRKRSDLQNKTPTSSCVLELAGIGSAVTHFQSYLVNLKKPLIIFTDSKSAVSAYKKFVRDGELNQSMKISSFLAALHGVNYTLEFIESTSKEIASVDYISRNQLQISKNCDPPCKICNVEKYIMGRQYNQFVSDFQVALSKINFYKSLDIPTINSDRYFVLMMDDHPFEEVNKKELSQYVLNYDFDTFWKIPEVRINHIRNAPLFFQGKISDLFNSTAVLQSWQNYDQDIKNVINNKKLGLDPTNMVERTLMRTKKAFLEDNILKVSTFKNGRRFDLIVLPTEITENLFYILHNTIGHNSFSAFKTEFYRLFFVSNSERILKRKHAECIQCQAFARQPRLIKSLKNIPIPETIGEQLLLDEFSRQSLKNEPWRFVFVTESLSRFSKLYPYSGHMNSETFLQILKRVNNDFCLTNSLHKNTILHIRCDKLSVHKAVADNPKVKQMKIQLEFHESTRNSKNHIAELDGRLAKISKILNLEMRDGNKTIEDVAQNSTLKYNNLRGFEGFAPREIYTSRDLFHNKQLFIDLKVIKNSIAKAREASRKCMEAKLNLNAQNGLEFIEHDASADAHDVNGPNNYEKSPFPLKLGDIILIDSDFIKDNLRPYFQIVNDPETNKCINWDENVVYCNKVNVQNHKLYIFHFSVIKRVFDGKGKYAEKILQNDFDSIPQFFKLETNPLRGQGNPLHTIKPLQFIEISSESENEELSIPPFVDSGLNSIVNISDESVIPPVATPINKNNSIDSAYESNVPKSRPITMNQGQNNNTAKRQLNITPIIESDESSSSKILSPISNESDRLNNTVNSNEISSVFEATKSALLYPPGILNKTILPESEETINLSLPYRRSLRRKLVGSTPTKLKFDYEIPSTSPIL